MHNQERKKSTKREQKQITAEVTDSERQMAVKKDGMVEKEEGGGNGGRAVK